MSVTQKILYIVSHPIQYQAPLLRYLTKNTNMNLSVLFYWDREKIHFDEGFSQVVTWDVPVLEGYQYHYLNHSDQPKNIFQKLLLLWKKIHPQQQDVVWVHGYTDYHTFFAIVFAKLKGVKVWVRGESMVFPDEKRISLKKIIRKIFFYGLNKWVDYYLAIGTNNKNFYRQHHISLEKIILCPYTVDNDFFHQKFLAASQKITQLKNQLQLEQSRLVILYASKFITRKYPIDLLCAYQKTFDQQKNNRPYLLFIGTGETLESVKASVLPDLMHDVKFLGFKNQSELTDYYTIADVVVLPSVHENWGLMINEAMNAECAVIVSDQVGCAKDLIQQNRNGFVYPARNIHQLSNYLKILSENRALCEKMKSHGKAIIAHWGLVETAAGLLEACRKNICAA